MPTRTKNENRPDASQLEGRYANYFKVGNNAFEFVLDFGQFNQESRKAQLHTRIITNPAYAKALLEIVRESIESYETKFGSIREE